MFAAVHFRCAVLLSVLVAGCGQEDTFDPQPVALREASAARAAIGEAAQAERERHDRYTRGAKSVYVAKECFTEERGRVYCQVVYSDFFYDDDRWCTAGFVADRSGAGARRVRVGDLSGPGFECGTYSEDGDPFAP